MMFVGLKNAMFPQLKVEDVRVQRILGVESPLFLGRAAAKVCISGEFLQRRQLIINGHACGFDEPNVRVRALAELVERLSPYVMQREFLPLHRGTVVQMSQGSNRIILKPESLMHFSSEQRASLKIPCLTSHSVFSWLEANRVTTGEKAWVPASAVFPHWIPPQDEERFFHSNGIGLAAHEALDRALLSATRELVERDVCTLAWRIPGWPVWELETSAFLSPRVAEATKRNALSVRLFASCSPTLPPALIALVFRGSDYEELTCGTSCGELNNSTAEKALSEAMMLQWTARQFDGKRDSVTSEIPTTFLDHVLWAFHHGPDVVHWFRSQADKNRLQRIPPSPNTLVGLAEGIENNAKAPLLFVDLTNDLSTQVGMHVVCAINANLMRPEMDGTLPYLGGSRLLDMVEKWKIQGETLNLLPHPFG